VKNFLINENIITKEIHSNYNLVFNGLRLRNCIKNYKKKKNFLIIPEVYNGDNFEIYCKKFENYFNIILEILTISLNNYHEVNYDKKYWKILISPWLINFLQIFFDKWINFKNINNNIKIHHMHSIVDVDDIHSKFTPVNSSDLVDLSNNISWNLYINEIIASEIFKDINYYRLNIDYIKNNKFHKKKKLINFGKNNKFFTLYNDFSFVLKTLINHKFFQIPNNGEFNLEEKCNYSLTFRKNFKLTKNINKNNDDFLNFFLKQLKFHIPCSMIENFKQNKNLVKNSEWPTNPKIIASSRGLWFKDDFSFYYAEKYRLYSTKLHYFQHGSEYGSSKFFLREKIEIDISDKFYSWGWNIGKGIVPIGISKKTNFIHKPKNNNNIMLITRLQKFKFTFHHGHFFGKSWVDYQTSNLKFLRELSRRNYKKKIIVRLKKTDNILHNTNIYNKFKNVVIDKGEKDLNFYKKKYFFIFTYNSSVFLEFLSQNIPCMCLIDKNYKFNELGEYHYSILKKLDIVCEDPSELAKKYLHNLENFEKWWNNKEKLALRQSFCKVFAKTSKNYLSELFKNFEI